VGEKQYLDHVKGKKHEAVINKLEAPYKCFDCHCSFEKMIEFVEHNSSKSHIRKITFRIGSQDKSNSRTRSTEKVCPDWVDMMCTLGDRCRMQHPPEYPQPKNRLNVCADFQINGYCGLGVKCKQQHLSSFVKYHFLFQRHMLLFAFDTKPTIAVYLKICANIQTIFTLGILWRVLHAATIAQRAHHVHPIRAYLFS
jgi:hypothetical protein